MSHYESIRRVIERVRRRWRTVQALDALWRAALACIVVVGAGLVAALWTNGAPALLATIAIVTVVFTVAALGWALLPLRRSPGDRQVARFIEERAALDDRLVTAVDVAERAPAQGSPLLEPMLADAARRVDQLDLEAVLPSTSIRRAMLRTALGVAVFLAVLFAGRGPARQAFDAAALTLFPDRVALDVSPGTTRIKAGSPLSIQARLVGNRAPVIAQLQVAVGDGWRSLDMATAAPGSFRFTTEPLSASFRYRVVAGTIVSPVYDVTVAHPPRVMRIDVDYHYPAGLNLKPRTEQDSGDIYAPAGTDVRVHVITDRPVASGQMTLGNGRSLPLASDKPNEFSAALKVVDDNSYRVALTDPDGLGNPGETEYFIRTLEDRPPEVRILKPATDRSVTRLEEVDVEAQAEDDYGVAKLDLVYSVRGGPEQTVPLPIPPKSATVTSRHTIYLEDLDVKPGDFVSYYVRAKDLTRGTRPNEARSDIFFLEVKPYEQEFQLAQSSSMAGGGASGNIDDLVAAQKDIVVATWKLDRRAQTAKGAKSEQDIKSVGRAESELKTRVEQTSSSFRESNMRDPRRRQGQRGRGAGEPPLRAGETMPEEDDMTAAAEAMGRAAGSLDALKTKDAISPEMEALNHLLKAQAQVKKREVMRQQAGSGAGNNNRNYDMSGLFDKELQKQQQTNYETKSTSEQKESANQSELDKIRDLARRQDELLKQQADLAKKRGAMSEEELKRELEKLTREQSELRQAAEELARQMTQNGQQQSASSQDQQGQRGQQGQQGQRGQSGQQQGQSGQQAQSGQQGQGAGGGDKRMRDVSDEMRSAANDLRRQNPDQASASANRALQKLRELERQMQAGRPDEQRRAIGEMQLEARQLADAERQISSELAKAGQSQSESAKDSVRRLAGEQERLADRARRLRDGLKQQASAPTDQSEAKPGADGRAAAAASKAAAGQAARDLERTRVAERMQQSADAMRAAAERAGSQRGNTAPGAQSGEVGAQAAAQDAMARELDKVADSLAAGAGARDADSQKLSEQLARVQAQREKLDALGREVDRLGRQNGASGQRGGQSGSSGQPSANAQKGPGEAGRGGDGQQGGGTGGSDLAKLRDEYAKQLQETRDLLNQLSRDDKTLTQGGGAGFTFEGRGMVMSAPGTEAFKQDFAKWDDLKRQATLALEGAESALSKKLQAKEARDRLAAGAADKAPPEYQKQVDSYFKAIASKKKP